MNFSVVVCTRNRADMLATLLASLARAAQEFSDEWELIAVDNGSEDRTPAVLDAAKGSLPLRIVSEATPGLSRARNAGWRLAKGKFCIFVDDDCRVPEGWLAAWQRGIVAWPDAGFFGAPLLAVFEPRKPAWADPGNYGFLFCHFDPRADEGPVSFEPWGGNMCIRRTLLAEFGGFDVRFGLAGKKMLGGEETMLLNALRAKGAEGVFLPDAWTWHVNDSRRLNLRYAWRRSVGQGRTMALMSSNLMAEGESAAPVTWRRFGGNVTGAAKGLLRRPSALAFGRVWVQSGLAWGHFLQLRERVDAPAQ